MKKILTAIRNYYYKNTYLLKCIVEIREILIDYINLRILTDAKNPLNKFGQKIFSQTDEDGITIEILRRINFLTNGTFIEMGVGNGTENNTLILKAMGWKGVWIGNKNLSFKLKPSKKFSYLRNYINLDNIINLIKEGLYAINSKNADVISIDLDGNDIYFVEKILANSFFPKLFIVEYNAKFPPPIRWQIEYNCEHIWQSDDYFGASLSSFNDLFVKYEYQLICCNLFTGANAFFIKKEFANLFNEVPKKIEDIYCRPRYYLYNFSNKTSNKIIEKLFN
jgi:hypothetical protein